MLKLYNTLTRKKEIFKPLRDKRVRLYTCGPTVYNYAHIGNLRTYVFEDILRRTLEYNGYKVKQVMNITDVGHLTSDADTGEDKLDKEARLERKSPREIANFYTKAFLNDIKNLNIKTPNILEPATKHIKEQQGIIKKLFAKGLAYETGAAVYFDVKKYGIKRYARLSRQQLSQKISGARKEVIVDPQKRHPADFVLWFKRVGKFKNHILHWPSPWGQGFPGWHIECSAISIKYLSQPFDIHTGGVDHIGTHHTNEIAQSEGAFGKPLAKFWLHGEFLLIDKSKMAKSEGNFITLQTIIDKGFEPLAFRYLVLNSHYRSKLNFSWKSLEAAQNGLQNLKDKVGGIKRGAGATGDRKKWDETFLNALNSNLNTALALSAVRGMLSDNRLSPKTKLSLVKQFDKILGLNLIEDPKKLKIPLKIKELMAQREKFRSNKQFIQADRLRKEIERLGYRVEDTPQGPALKKNSNA